MAADVPPLGRRSYVQTRFLATEDSSTLTIALRVSSYKKHTLPKSFSEFHTEGFCNGALHPHIW